MVSYDTILFIIKHSVTVKSIKEQISPLVREMTDNDEEYDFLMSKIPVFYADYYNRGIEHIEVWDYDNNVYMNDGTSTSVEHPEEVKMMGHDKPFLLSIHNHPNKESEVQSEGDYALQAEYNTKYGVSVGFHGLVITKNGYPFDPALSVERGDDLYVHSETAVMRLFRKLQRNDPECLKIKEDYDEERIEMDEMNERLNKVYSRKLNENTPNVVEEQNKVFIDHDIPFVSKYVPIRKVYE